MIRALIVDDESLVRKGMRLVFPWQKYGIEIAGEAASGEKALDFLRDRPVQLLLTDITMPGMSGLELIREAQNLLPDMKAVILTCHQDFEYIQEALRMGAIDYIVKTQLEDIDLDRTMERIVKAVGRQAQEQGQSQAVGTGDGDGADGVEWLLDDEKFARLSAAVAAVKADRSEVLQQRLIRAAERWKIAFPNYDWPAETPPPMEAAAALLWLGRLRGGIQIWLRRPGYSEEVMRAIAKAVDKVMEQPGGHARQEDISRHVGLSKSYFSTSFREIARQPFSHFVQAASMHAARSLLVSTNQPVYWIAERCGFVDQRYFSKLFKEQTGLLPSEYRQQYADRL